MSNDLEDFKKFMKRREQAAEAYVSGNAEPLSEIVTDDLPATFFSPNGDYRQGAEKVSSTYKNDAKSFEQESTSHFEILQMSVSDGIGYWVGFQKASVRMSGKSEPVPFNLRITEIFRREGDEWKMVHRHADVLKNESEKSDK